MPQDVLPSPLFDHLTSSGIWTGRPGPITSHSEFKYGSGRCGGAHSGVGECAEVEQRRAARAGASLWTYHGQYQRRRSRLVRMRPLTMHASASRWTTLLWHAQWTRNSRDPSWCGSVVPTCSPRGRCLLEPPDPPHDRGDRGGRIGH